jgi:hypothetical protein
MRFAVRPAGLLGLLLVLPVAADDKPAPPSNKDKDTKKYVEVGGLQGKLEKVNTTTQEMTISYRGIGKYAKTENKELTLADEAKVWFVTPPEKYDEEGNAKKLTKDELDKIKSKYGPTKGLYAGELTDLRPGQQIKVSIGKPKDAAKRPAPKDKSAAPEKEFVYVTTVVVMVDAKPAKPDKKK